MELTRDQIISSNPLLDYVENEYTVKSVGNRRITNGCPITSHKRGHYCVNIDTEKEVWFCNDCKQGGSVIDWVMKEKQVDVNGAIKLLSGDVEASSQDGKASPVLTPGESKEVAQYNYTNENGQLLYQVVRYEPKTFKQRRPDGDDWEYNLSGVTRVLYNLPKVLMSSKVFVVEGEKDAETLNKLGYVATTNAGGAGNWLDSYADTLKGKDIIVIRDMDNAGKKHQDRVVQSLQDRSLSIQTLEPPSGFKDVSAWMESLDCDDTRRKAVDGLIDSTPHLIDPLPIYSLRERQDLYKEFLKKQASRSFSMSSVHAGFADLVDPLMPGEVVMFVGDTGAGKTAVMQKIAQVAAPRPTLMFELELPVAKMFEREVQIGLGCFSSDVKRDYMDASSDNIGRIGKFGEHVWICDQSGIDMPQIEKYIRKSELKIGEHPSIVMIDYMGLVRKDLRNGRYEAIANAAEQSKVVAKRTNVIMFEGSQIARPENRKAASEIFLHSAKGAGELESSANLVISLIRPAPDLLEMTILKATSGVSGGKLDFKFNGKTLQITEQ